jgi:hypothetical protein
MPGTSEQQARSRAGPGADQAGAPGVRPWVDPGAGVLADRIAAGLVNHEPGWRLPRASELARRHNVSADEIRTAIDHLVSRQVVRRSPDGRLYLASPAEYLVSLEGMADLGVIVDPMGGNLTRLSYGASRRPASEDAACALRVKPGELVGVLRLAWALNGTPAAMSTTYLAGDLAEPHVLASWLTAGTERGELPLPPPTADCGSSIRDLRPALRPRAVSVQMQLPPASVTRRLRLATDQMAVLVTVLFGDDPGDGPAALTAAVLRPDMFRITVETPPPWTSGASSRAAWSLATVDDGPW